MNEMKKKEIEVLAKLCYDSGLPLRLAKDLLKSSETLSYENISDRGRIKEYEDLIVFHANKL